MDVDDLDIYNDLDNFQEEENKKSKELLALEAKCNDQLKTIESLHTENAALKKNIKTIEVNLQNLLDTAKAEIKRKDKQINELRRDYDDICFRRKQPTFATAADGRSRIGQEMSTAQHKAGQLRSTSTSVAVEHKPNEVNSLAEDAQRASTSTACDAKEPQPARPHKRVEPRNSFEDGKRRFDDVAHGQHEHVGKHYQHRDRSDTRRSGRDTHKTFHSIDHSRQQDREYRDRRDNRERDPHCTEREGRSKRKYSPVERKHVDTASRRDSRHHKKEDKSLCERRSSKDYSKEKDSKERRYSGDRPRATARRPEPLEQDTTQQRKEKERRKEVCEVKKEETDELKNYDAQKKEETDKLKNYDATTNTSANTSSTVKVFDSGREDDNPKLTQSLDKNLKVCDNGATCTALLKTGSQCPSTNTDENSNLTRMLTTLNTPKKAALYDSLFGCTPSSAESLTRNLRPNVMEVLSVAHDTITTSPSSYTDDSEQPPGQNKAKQQVGKFCFSMKKNEMKLNKEHVEVSSAAILNGINDIVEEYIPGLGDAMPFEKAIEIFGENIKIDADTVNLLMDDKKEIPAKAEAIKNDEDAFVLTISDDENVEMLVQDDVTRKASAEIIKNVRLTNTLEADGFAAPSFESGTDKMPADGEHQATNATNNGADTLSKGTAHNEYCAAKMDVTSHDAVMEVSIAAAAGESTIDFSVSPVTINKKHEQQEIVKLDSFECKRDLPVIPVNNDNTSIKDLSTEQHKNSVDIEIAAEIIKKNEECNSKEYKKTTDQENISMGDSASKVDCDELLANTKTDDVALHLQPVANITEISREVGQVETVQTAAQLGQEKLEAISTQSDQLIKTTTKVEDVETIIQVNSLEVKATTTQSNPKEMEATTTQADQSELIKTTLPVSHVEKVGTPTLVNQTEMDAKAIQTDQVELVEITMPVHPVEVTETTTPTDQVKLEDEAQCAKVKDIVDSICDSSEQLILKLDCKEAKEKYTSNDSFPDNQESPTTALQIESTNSEVPQTAESCKKRDSTENIAANLTEIGESVLHTVNDVIVQVENESNIQPEENFSVESAVDEENDKEQPGRVINTHKLEKKECTTLNEKENKSKTTTHKQRKDSAPIANNKNKRNVKTELDIHCIKKETENTKDDFKKSRNQKQSGESGNALIENMKRAEIIWKYRIPKLGAKPKVKTEVNADFGNATLQMVPKKENNEDQEYNDDSSENTVNDTTGEHLCDNAEVSAMDNTTSIPLRAVQNNIHEPLEQTQKFIEPEQLKIMEVEYVEKPTVLEKKKRNSSKRHKVVSDGAHKHEKRKAKSSRSKRVANADTQMIQNETFAIVSEVDKQTLSSSTNIISYADESQLQPQLSKRKRCKMRIEDSEDESINTVSAVANEVPTTEVEATRDDSSAIVGENRLTIPPVASVLKSPDTNCHDEQSQSPPLKRKCCKLRLADSEDEVEVVTDCMAFKQNPTEEQKPPHNESCTNAVENGGQCAVSYSTPTNNTSNDERFREIDSRLQSMFESPCKVEVLQERSAFPVLLPPLPTTSAAAAEATAIAAQQQEFNVSDTLISDMSIQSTHEHSSSAVNLTIDETNGNSVDDSSLNDTNGSLGTKQISLGSSDYRFEKISDNVVNLFITRKRRGKIKAVAIMPT